MAPILEVRNLTHTYSAGTPFEHKAIDNMNFSVQRGEFIGIIGLTGSGKSTLMQHLNGLGFDLPLDLLETEDCAQAIYKALGGN